MAPADGTATPDGPAGTPNTTATPGSDEGSAPLPTEPVLIALGVVTVVTLRLVATYRRS